MKASDATGRARLISVVMPAYNEQEALELTFERLARTFAGTPYQWELVVVNDK